MKKAVISVSLIAFVSLTANAQNSNRPHKVNGAVVLAERVLSAYERANDSINRKNQIYKLRDNIVQLNAALNQEKSNRHEIEKFHVGRTPQQKSDQEKDSDIKIGRLQNTLNEANLNLAQFVQIYREVYGEI